MNKENRIQKIAEIINRGQPHGEREILWQLGLISMKVYLIPLEYLVYNKYNGRILSETKSLESQNILIDVESESGKKRIEDLLFGSNPSGNRQTLESLKKIGQQEVGIITRDGVIVDGNRRAMLLKQANVDFFKAVVLDVTSEEDPIQIQKLETIYQMGQDEKLGYNAIEKYLKVKELEKLGVERSKIAEWMGEPEPEIKELAEVMKTMDDYLDYLGYNGIYTQLEGREDQFINLTRCLNNFYGERSSKAFYGYRDRDVEDLRIISYDYIRVRYEGKEFRKISFGLQENHFFGNKEIWESFRAFHFDHIEHVKPQEIPINLKIENLKAHLNDRDQRFLELTKNPQGESFLTENIDLHDQRLRRKKTINEPLKLLDDAGENIETVSQNKQAFSQDGVLKRIQDLNDKTFDMLKNKDADKMLSQIIKLLESVKFKDSDSKDELCKKLIEIGKISFRRQKEL